MNLQEHTADDDTVVEQAAAAAGTLKPTYPRMSLRLLIASRTNPREDFNEAKLRELADSIVLYDVLEPLVVRTLPASRIEETAGERPRPTHEVVAGERRLRAARLAGLKDVPYVERELTDEQVLEIQLVENLQREDLNPLEEAKGYRRLMDDEGIQATDIAKKIGMSRAYVYNTVKLLTLSQEGRDALLTGDIDRSRAELLATIGQPKLQLKALKEFAQRNSWNGRRMSVVECKQWLEKNVLLKMKDAPFDVKAADLVPGCGACAECPKRTHADRDIFAAFDGPDMCTDPVCWNDKETASLERIRVKHQADGCEVIAGKQAKKLKSQWSDDIKGYTRLDAKHDDGKGNNVSIGKLLGADAPKPVIFVDPVTQREIKVLRTEVVGAALKEKGLVKETAADRTKKQEAAREREQAKQQIAAEARIRATRDVATKLEAGEIAGFTAGMLRLLLLDTLGQAYHSEPAPLLDLWHLPTDDSSHAYHKNRLALVAHINAAPDQALGVMLLQVLLVQNPSEHWFGGKELEVDYLAQFARDAGVDLAGIEKEIASERKAAERAIKGAVATAGATSEAAPQGSDAREGEAAPPAGKPRKRAPKVRLTAEEAQQGIAYAMQGEEADQGGEDLQGENVPVSPFADLPHASAAVVQILHAAGFENGADLFDVTSDELSGLTGLEVDEAHALLHAARSRILAAEARPAATGDEIILAGAQVKILETVKDARRLRWVGKSGAVLGRLGDRGYDVSFASRGGGRVTFDRSEIEVLS